MIAFALLTLAASVVLAHVGTTSHRRFNAAWGTDDPAEWRRALCMSASGGDRP